MLDAAGNQVSDVIIIGGDFYGVCLIKSFFFLSFIIFKENEKFWIWIATADAGGCHGDCVSIVAACRVCDSIIMISTGVADPIHFLDLSIVPKPRPMRRIRLPWLPFGMDLQYRNSWLEYYQ